MGCNHLGKHKKNKEQKILQNLATWATLVIFISFLLFEPIFSVQLRSYSVILNAVLRYCFLFFLNIA